MKFWDSSAIVPVLVQEKQTKYCMKLLADDSDIVVWYLTKVEVMSALCRRWRQEEITDAQFEEAKKRLSFLLDSSYEVTAIQKVRARAIRLLQVHALRAADACQLGAALVVCQEEPARMEMVCFDHLLSDAAKKEGFVINPAL